MYPETHAQTFDASEFHPKIFVRLLIMCVASFFLSRLVIFGVAHLSFDFNQVLSLDPPIVSYDKA